MPRDFGGRQVFAPQFGFLTYSHTRDIGDIYGDRIHRYAADQWRALAANPDWRAIVCMARVTIAVADSHCGDTTVARTDPDAVVADSIPFFAIPDCQYARQQSHHGL